MDLVDYGYVEQELERFDIPSRPGACIMGPKDLTGRQDDQLTAIVKALPDDASNILFYLTVLEYYVQLPGARWNLARREVQGDDDSRLIAIPLTPETVRNEIRRADRAAIALAVSKLLYPIMFEQFGLVDTITPEDEDAMEGLAAEPGSQAGEPEETPDPNSDAPSSDDGESPASR